MRMLYFSYLFINKNNDNLKEATQAAKRSLELGNEAAKIILGKNSKKMKNLRKEGNTLELGNEVTKITVGETQEDETLMKEGFNALKRKWILAICIIRIL